MIPGSQAHPELPPTPLPGRGASRSWSFNRPLLAVLAIALAARLWRLDAAPPAFFCDECDNAAFAIRILEGQGPGLYGFDWKPQPALAVHLIAASVAVVGPSLVAVRLPSALLSVVALVPFYWLARRLTSGTAALLATLLLSFHPAYLHFSRTGWENIQVCLWTLGSMAAITAGMESGRRTAWMLAGVFAAIGSLTYFSGRAIPVFIGVFAVISALTGTPSRRREILLGFSAFCGAFAVVCAPLVPQIVEDWDLFNQRTARVFFTVELPPNATPWETVSGFLQNGLDSAAPFFAFAFAGSTRYFPGDRGLLNAGAAVLFVVGLVRAWRLRRGTALWWFALVLPFVATQMLTKRTPDIARGIAILPIVYLFVALAWDWAFRAFGRRLAAQVAAAVLATWMITDDVTDYVRFVRSPALAAALEPAVPREEFDAWWAFQRSCVRAGRPFVSVDHWLARDRTARAD